MNRTPRRSNRLLFSAAEAEQFRQRHRVWMCLLSRHICDSIRTGGWLKSRNGFSQLALTIGPCSTSLPWPDFIDNGKRKAESINEFIGLRPTEAFGSSEWAAAGNEARLMFAGASHRRRARVPLRLGGARRPSWTRHWLRRTPVGGTR